MLGLLGSGGLVWVLHWLEFVVGEWDGVLVFVLSGKI